MNDLRTLRPVEALAESGTLLNRRLWLILLPIGLDLFIWFAPSVIAGSELIAGTGGTASSLQDGASADNPNLLDSVRQWNLLALILGAWVPTIGVAASGEGEGAVRALESFQELLLALVLLVPVGFIVGGAYLALIASAVQERTLTWEVLLPRVVRLAVRLGGLVGVMLVISVAPFAIAGLFLALIPFIGALLLLLAIVFLLWIAFYVFFIVDSLALVRQSLPKVIRLTLELLHSNPWSYVGFFFLYWLILLGTSLIWNVMLDLRILNIGVGRVIATVGNAYVGTWVTIAIFMFIWNRLLIHREGTSSA